MSEPPPIYYPIAWRLQTIQASALFELILVTWHSFQVNDQHIQTKPTRLAFVIDVACSVAAISRTALVPLSAFFLPTEEEDAPTGLDERSTFAQVLFALLASLLPFSLLYLVSFMMLVADHGTPPQASLLVPPLVACCYDVFLAARLWTGWRSFQVDWAQMLEQRRRGTPHQLIGQSLMTSADFRTFVFGDTEEGFAQQTCSICFNEFRVGAVLAQLPCGHIFHWGCIDAWLMRSSSCPMRCNVNVDASSEVASDVDAAG
mmetsp:Transcript_30349/g.69958  ORF Transcript_30349/g.69958 Transcript_30349/m.69958 type:complete len:260 (+) Transcript_30349:92-871(+)